MIARETTTESNGNDIGDILACYNRERESLIPIFQKIQEKLGYISEEASSAIAKHTGMSESEVFGVASFYTQFRFVPQGKQLIRVCLGTACHVRGGRRVLEELERKLGIRSGETTEDLKFSLEQVNCLGCCALGPVVVIGREYHGKVTPGKVAEILEKYR